MLIGDHQVPLHSSTRGKGSTRVQPGPRNTGVTVWPCGFFTTAASSHEKHTHNGGSEFYASSSTSQCKGIKLWSTIQQCHVLVVLSPSSIIICIKKMYDCLCQKLIEERKKSQFSYYICVHRGKGSGRLHHFSPKLSVFFCSCHNFFPLSSVQIIFIPACCLLCVL